MDVLLRQQFGLAPDLWGRRTFATADAARVASLVGAAVRSRLMVSIAGPRGSGKSRAVRDALGSLDAQVVTPLRLDREKLHLGDIQVALVTGLSDQPPRRSGEARSGQTRRVLGAAAARGAVVLWIDDAHLLHPSTLRGLKRLLELGWQGRSPLLGIVLTGQQDRTANLPEVGLRSSRMTFAGLTADEAATAVRHVLPGVEEATVQALAASPRARNWLDLGQLLDACCNAALRRGLGAIDAGSVDAALENTPTEPAAEPAGQAPSDAAVAALLEREAA